MVETSNSPDHAVDVLDRVETGEPLDAFDRILASDALSAYLDGTPDCDREPAQAALAAL